jgi:hypothetical protein
LTSTRVRITYPGALRIAALTVDDYSPGVVSCACDV